MYLPRFEVILMRSGMILTFFEVILMCFGVILLCFGMILTSFEVMSPLPVIQTFIVHCNRIFETLHP